MTLDSADSLLAQWAAWQSIDDTAPRPPGNHWRFGHLSGYREPRPTPVFDDCVMCGADAAVATLRRDSEADWLVLRANYCQRKQRSELALERALPYPTGH